MQRQFQTRNVNGKKLLANKFKCKTQYRQKLMLS